MPLILADIIAGPSAIAVSGGVDSMTLAVFAHRLLGRDSIAMMHAMSPAVPQEASERVRHWARSEGWDLHIFDAGEFGDPNYIANPVNRCFFCKSNLYGSIAKFTDRQIFSGANTDDLGEYRPGLDAARDSNVRHPYLEIGMGKADVRLLSRALNMGALAELPASPCLSSRVETKIPIDPDILKSINAAESIAKDVLRPNTVRCRVRHDSIVIELDEDSLARVDPVIMDGVTGEVAKLFLPVLSPRPIRFQPYRNGSAFIGARP
ncbi:MULTISPECIES: adenine nucleotide alpha hydrolase [Rhizobium]|uniref:Adenine nucleotide alpha hydrolase n=1 Tax=Rhizobium leguminosarum bv. viciae TaxID=387 RepID=A0A8G2IQG2_RHILV|nr:adenine nucleotide alpha hydrolase [Rhizobium leguminosarum]MBY5473353.1 adenine nucleotide alpha hydrolase [Rhizobium leguminosarum]NEI02874.1 adenine nucleotide alpha hydrolase [Rhizobium leguminosarum]NKK10898.1 adenine nucleotide alpha hydrolase [Rhizobium leguminosarum bv. viciae]NKK24364.1 adenine nucleotide alpha hydrolase [Rhizobium leguminosarum bv. viciae]NKL73745.1 adenine nucleotide alpha hydrolase [Rhizobium leguminosarum bv. viciae]